MNIPIIVIDKCSIFIRFAEYPHTLLERDYKGLGYNQGTAVIIIEDDNE